MQNNYPDNSKINSQEILNKIILLVNNTPNDQKLGSKMRRLINLINSENNNWSYSELSSKEEKN